MAIPGFQQITQEPDKNRPRFGEETPYDILDTPRTSDDHEIKMAYIQKVKKFSPELYPEEFVEIRKAYEALKEPNRHAATDLFLLKECAECIGFEGVEECTRSQVKLTRQVNETAKSLESGNTEARDELIGLLKERSLAFVDRKLWDDAIRDWEKILSLEPEGQEAKKNILLGQVKKSCETAEAKNLDEAYKLFQELLANEPDDERMVHNAAILATAKYDTELEVKYWNKLLRIWKARLDKEPENEYVQYLIIESQKCLPEHVFDQEDIIPEVEVKDSNANVELAISLIEVGQYPRARAILQRCLDQGDESMGVYDNLAWAHLHSGDHDNAFKTWRKSLRVHKNEPQIKDSMVRAHLQTGKNLYENGHFTPAVAHLKRALATDPKNSEAYDLLAQIYLDRGDHDTAIKMWTKALRLNPKNKQIQKLIRAAKLKTRR